MYAYDQLLAQAQVQAQAQATDAYRLQVTLTFLEMANKKKLFFDVFVNVLVSSLHAKSLPARLLSTSLYI